MKRIAAVLVLGLAAVACGGAGAQQDGGDGSESEPIKIGVVGPMTGLASFVGKNMVEGVQLALDDINAKGGLLGRQVEFVVRDDEYLPDKTPPAARDLIEKEGVVALFGPSGTSNYLGISRMIREEHVPTWAIISGPELTDDVNPYAFRAYLPDREQAAFLAEFAARRYRRIAIISQNDGEGEAFNAAATATLKKLGKTPVAVELFSEDEVDFSPVVQKLKKKGADAVIVGNHIGVFVARIAAAAKNLDLGAQLLGVAGMISYTYPDLAREAADGTIFVSFRTWGDLPRAQWPEATRTFYERYVSTYLKGREFSQTGAYRAYSTNFLTFDMVRIWAYAVEKAGSVDGAKVAETLNAGFTYPADRSVIAVPWTYTAKNHDGIKPEQLYVYRWKRGSNGKFKLEILGNTTDVLAGKAGV